MFSTMEPTTAPPKVTVSLKDILQHQTFLRAVSKTLPNKGKTISCSNFTRYQNQWLPLVAKYPEEALIPPLDIAWIWHAHRLAPLLYTAYCKEEYGHILDQKSTFKHTTHNNRTHELWAQHYPGVPFHAAKQPAQGQQSFAIGCGDTSYDLAKACCRQSSFLQTISGPIFSSAEYLSHAIQQYTQFLLVVKHSHEFNNQLMVPSIAIDLVWHTHQLLSTSNYIKETTSIAGFPVNHNDNIDEQVTENETQTDLLFPPKATLQRQWTQTRSVWKEMFGSPMNEIAIPICIENFISTAVVDTILNQLPSNGGYDSIKHEELQSLKTSALVPTRLKESMRQAMFTTCNDQAAASLAAPASPEPMHEAMPVRIKKGPAKVHQDRENGIKGRPPLDAFVALLYVKGAGTMRFVSVHDKHICYDIEIKPCSLIFFPNALFTHEVLPSNTQTRVMLGPIYFDGANAVPAGLCGGCAGCGAGAGCSSGRGNCATRSSKKKNQQDASCCCDNTSANVAQMNAENEARRKRLAAKMELQQQNKEKAQSMANQPSMVIAPQEQEMFRQQTVVVSAPPGCHCGDPITILVDGVPFIVRIPPGVVAGQDFYVQAPVQTTSMNTKIVPTATLDNTQVLQVPQVLEQPNIVDKDGKVSSERPFLMHPELGKVLTMRKPTFFFFFSRWIIYGWFCVCLTMLFFSDVQNRSTTSTVDHDDVKWY